MARDHRRAGCVAAGLLAAALAPPAAAEGPVAYVDVPAILDAAPQAQAARERLEQEFGPREREIETRLETLRERREALSRNAAVLSATQRRDRESELRALQREIERERDWFREDLNQRRGALLGEVREEIRAIVRLVAESEGYELVLTGGIAYASDATEITDLVVRRLEAAHRDAGG